MKKKIFGIVFALLLVVSIATSWAEELVIGHVTDSHIGTASFQRFVDALSGASQLSDVFVVSGDCTNNGAEKQLEKFMTAFEGLETPYLLIPGNHDVIKGETNWNKVVGPSESYLDIGNFRIIGFNSLDINWAFLAQALSSAASAGKISILVGHFPIFDHRGDTANRKYSVEQRERLREMFKYYQVPIYISGHEHADYLELDQETGTYYLGGKAPPYFRLIFLEDREVKAIVSGKLSNMKAKIIPLKKEKTPQEIQEEIPTPTLEDQGNGY